MNPIPMVVDRFSCTPVRHLGYAKPGERRKLLKWVRNYLRACEREDSRTPAFRERVNK